MGAKEILDPTGERERQFNRIFNFVGKSPRPKSDYSGLSHAEFSSIHFLRRCFEIQASFMFLLRSFAAAYSYGFIPEIIAQKGGLSLQEILDWGRQLTPEVLCESHCIYPEIGLTTFLIDLKFEEVFMVRELENRMRNRRLSAELILLDWEGLDRIKEIQKLLQVDRIKSFKSNLREHEDMDIRQNAWVNALEHWRQPSALVTKDSRLPAFPLNPYLPMLPAEKKFWKGPKTRAWNQGRKSWMREAVPIFQGDKEVSGKVRDAQREQWRTLKHRKTIREGSQEQIRSEIHPEHDENRRADVSANMVDILRRAKTEWGAKAVKALRAEFEGNTEEESAKLAGITARTLRNYKLKLTKYFSKKNNHPFPVLAS